MREPMGFGQPGCTSVRPRSESVREAMAADLPGMFALWGSRAHAVIDSQIRRRKNRKAEEREEQQRQQQEEQGTQNTGGNNRSSEQQQPPTKPAQKPKREWWRLDPNVSDKYRPVEPPATPDPSVFPTPDRFVFGWEAPLSPIEQVLQEEVRRLLPNFHKWIVRRAIERAGLKAETDKRPPLPVPEDVGPDWPETPQDKEGNK